MGDIHLQYLSWVSWTLLRSLAWGFAACASTGQADATNWADRVHKLVVTRAEGTTELGSAVPLGGDLLVTNCHVLRDAVRIEAQAGDEIRLARADRRDAYRDICFLTAPGLAAPPMPMIELGETRVGLEVSAVGYPAGAFTIGEGRVIGLHSCECDGGKVIQTSAIFDRGASGGGLFDRQGRLVGILAFKAKAGGNFHFALPVGWLRELAVTTMQSGTGEVSFWEHPGRESGYFLAACDLGAQGKWRSLSTLASEWAEQEPNNPEAWMALGRARKRLGQAETAAQAFLRALMLDTTHVEATWALRELEFELERELTRMDGL